MLAARLRGFGPLGMIAIVLILMGNVLFAPLGAVLVLAWAKLSRTPWHEIGYARPASWVVSLATGIALGVVFKLVLKTTVMPVLGAPPLNQAYHYLIGNSAALPGMLLVATITGGFGEETLFRGYMFERLHKLLGASLWASALILLLTTGLFAMAHYPEQGLPGVQQATITGLVFGGLFATSKRIWVPMIAHAAFDITAITIIYLNLESDVAHVFFK